MLPHSPTARLDNLGKRLRDNHKLDHNPSEEDLKQLDKFRETYNSIDKHVFSIINEACKSVNTEDMTITKRKRKTQQSIIDKLCREETMKLSRMQDIVGCRIVLKGPIKRAQQVSQLLVQKFRDKELNVNSKTRDYLGYRAIHIIVKYDKKFYEIQIRTFAQDLWANLIEILSDKKYDLKYGKTNNKLLEEKFKKLSDKFAEIDKSPDEISFDEYKKQIERCMHEVLSN